MKIKKICLLCMAGIFLHFAACGQANVPEEKTMSQTQAHITDEQTTTYNSSYKAVAQACDWGPACIKAIIKLGEQVGADDLCGFRVTETNTNGIVGEREVTGVYICDENGRKIEGSAAYIAVEMSADPSHGGLLFYDSSCFYNVWDENYRLDIEPINPENEVLKNLTVDPKYTERLLPQADVFVKAEFQYQDTVMKYALYTPPSENGKKPLVIWLHGQGEGGDDVTITLFGNKVTALAADEIQGILGGAYVLIPQCPTYWPENSLNNQNFGMRANGTSFWEKPLLALIDEVIASNSGIDTDRIYIGGCSMGGYMTMLMAKNHTDYFAAAFPVCEFYEDRLLSDGDINALADVPLWFTYCTADETVSPKYYSQATVSRLEKAGARNLHRSVFSDIHDTMGKYFSVDGNPYLYNPHWVWVYVFNNECFEGELGLWEWLELQSRL